MPIVTAGQVSYRELSGTDIVLHCIIASTPTPTDVFWEKYIGGKYTRITIDGSKFNGATVHSPSLHISYSQISDSGIYRCGASNPLGSAHSDQITLNVTGSEYYQCKEFEMFI